MSRGEFDGRTVDLIVVGSGAGGLASAITAAHRGLDVLLLERESVLGGAAARSGGWMWLPGNRGRAADGDRPEQVRTYLDHVSGGRADTQRMDAFIETCRPMLDFLEEYTASAFNYPEVAPDYHMDAPGARHGGRAVSAHPFDLRELGQHRHQLAPPLTSMVVLGVMPQIGEELDKFVRANRSVRAFLYVLSRVIRTAVQRIRYGRGLQLSNGAALIGRLLKSALDAGVEVRTQCTVESLKYAGDRVAGIGVRSQASSDVIWARHGVVLACGGISHDVEARTAIFPHDATAANHVPAVPEGHDGSAVRLTKGLGADFDSDVIETAAWTPVTVFRGRGGCRRIFPHLRGMGLPGIIAVNRHGRRFTNESDSYHDFGQALRETNKGEQGDFAWLICDARTMHRYGIGYAKPWPMPRLRYFWNGYLTKARTAEALARKIGADPVGLARTLKQWNQSAGRGSDPEFRRGASEYNFFRGDRTHQPNPCLAPVEKPPFYAVRVGIGDLGAFAGLRTDARARVMRRDGSIIDGLYAVGSAASSPFGGAYPGYGAMLGPGMVFGYIAAGDAAQHAHKS